MSEKNKNSSKNSEKSPVKKDNKKENKNNVSIFENTDGTDAKNGGMTISLKNKGEIIEADTDVSFFKSFFSKKISSKDEEIIVINKKKTKGYAPVILAIVLFSGLLFTNVLCHTKLDSLSNDMASMTRELEELKEADKEYSYKLSQKDKAAMEEFAGFIEGELGMVKESPDKVYVDLQLEDETYIVEEDEKQNGWTTLLSSVGRFFSNIFG